MSGTIHGINRRSFLQQTAVLITKARRLLGYEPTQTVAEGLRLAMGWYRGQAGQG